MSAESSITRRSMFTATTAAGGALVLAACAPSKAETPAAPATAAPSVPAGTPVRVGKVSDVKVGDSASGTVNGKNVVVFRPDNSKVVAYDAACTHAGCPVAPAGQEFDCHCHGSTFKAADGSVINGPARKPLAPMKAAIDGEWITVTA